MRPEVRRAGGGDAGLLAPRLRAADREECLTGYGLPPEYALTHSVRNASAAFAIEHGGEVIGLFGVADAGTPEVGAPWLMIADWPLSVKRSFMKRMPDYVALLGAGYLLLHNLADARNVEHLRWLELAGFTFGDTVPFGPNNIPFREFYKSVP